MNQLTLTHYMDEASVLRGMTEIEGTVPALYYSESHGCSGFQPPVTLKGNEEQELNQTLHQLAQLHQTFCKQLIAVERRHLLELIADKGEEAALEDFIFRHLPRDFAEAVKLNLLTAANAEWYQQRRIQLTSRYYQTLNPAPLANVG